MAQNDAAIRKAVEQQCNLNSPHGNWVLVAVVNGHLELKETGSGIDALKTKFVDTEIQYALLTLRLTLQHIPDQPRHIFVHWKGQKCSIRVKGQGNEQCGNAQKVLAPSHGQLVVMGTNNFDEATVSQRWDPSEGSHEIY
eukprot:TRINITY_DN651_c0_g1_i1.p1 TRINITY_DN651_c0_g1~~TRINITY_DN651_c0_g1_i1.p1  ORF type:complete len:140 (-),score=36.28 TRINITY_DN651_c0_g1_i1:31-450(-)